MAKFAALPVVVCVVAFLGCAERAEPYERAMKRLVAEQKQLDWIDAKIKGKQAAKERVEKKFSEGIMSPDFQKRPGMTDEEEQEMNETEDRFKGAYVANMDSLDNEIRRWLQNRAAQLKRIEEARVAADGAR